MQRQYRLPHWYIPLSAGGIEKVLRDLGSNSELFMGVFGKDETYPVCWPESDYAALGVLWNAS